VETGIVLAARLGRDPLPLLMRFLQEFDITPVPFGPDHWRESVEAYLRYGKGRHPAGLNLGDCCSYAVARLADQPLLCAGDDFPQTDLALA
jgi:ribonuclease VapC